MFETVHTLPHWHDGPRQGIADYRGRPHLFESEWRDREDLDEDTFLLMPIDAATFALALEDWAIWRRWEMAFHQGKTTQETHPALPEDRGRHENLERLLDGRLTVDPARAVRSSAEFRARHTPGWSGCGWRPLEVRWSAPPGD
ncbi:hypothetical protein [Singulisphaera acidiphila]|uniref:Uncharacterized protein n=1 Tax=Singulisphaera acidiphila (strain ATCC BAA-1392 / DSM 18658 / VKM B-2454 / MOB10) TaxID=886293 RepID=L0DI92_SINAD|nr:hypothetical protein [Singulisphaera acidiphila]AGA28533.1 hypothetical protein Sinac_4336 [Singulisphaera acidiphila DSM 18658]